MSRETSDFITQDYDDDDDEVMQEGQIDVLPSFNPNVEGCVIFNVSIVGSIPDSFYDDLLAAQKHYENRSISKGYKFVSDPQFESPNQKVLYFVSPDPGDVSSHTTSMMFNFQRGPGGLQKIVTYCPKDVEIQSIPQTFRLSNPARSARDVHKSLAEFNEFELPPRPPFVGYSDVLPDLIT